MEGVGGRIKFGLVRFELTTSRSRTVRATKLRYSPLTPSHDAKKASDLRFLWVSYRENF